MESFCDIIYLVLFFFMERRKLMALCQQEKEQVCLKSPDGRHKLIVKSFPPKPEKGEKGLPYQFECLCCGQEFEIPYEKINKE